MRCTAWNDCGAPVVGAAVRRPQVNVLEAVVLKTEGNPDKATRALAGAGGRTSSQFDFDRTVVKRRILQNGVRFTICDLTVFRDLHGALPLVIDGLQFHIMRNQSIDGLSGSSRCRRDAAQTDVRCIFMGGL